ncbi:2-keto-3-deoxy-phosphogluconate aldolase [Homoserinimonas aerilata]|uniref:2-keto-3-deoxy-phosphogluconate aldolase n=2 Tax=Homoserinimonas aerilata TaxID=1162970 RepID=A0A542YGS9_9MICO|nr:2-keto-3-deoxy-phosphogluconate aldolase [Homoserinimonas aerilata]
MGMGDSSGDFIGGLRAARLLAIIRGSNADDAVATGLALIDEGVRYIEVSLTTPDALRVISALAADGRAHIGAGTVLTEGDVTESVAAGASFLLTPALAESVPFAVARGVPIIAGVFTPSEALAAMRQGATAVKLFPAAQGGPGYLKALREPFPQIPFLPVGGVDAAAAEQYLAVGAFAVGVGGPLIGDAASGGDLDALRARARDFVSRIAS